MYSIEFSQKADKFLDKLDNIEKNLILNKIYLLKKEPLRQLKRLAASKLYRLRIQKYRAIIDVMIHHKRIIILRIGYRKNIYNKK